MRIPEFLKENGSIGFVAPSFGCNIEPYKSAFDNAQKKFARMGYKIVLGPNCYEGSGIGISNTPEKCGDELNDFIINSKSDVIISCGGGELMCETLDFVDFDNISKAKPIWYMGFSDNTNMTFLLPVLCDTAAIYAPCAPAFGMREWHQSVEDAFGVLTGKKSTVSGYDKWERESLKTEENPLEPYNLTEPRILKSFNCDNEVSFAGRLIGGCLDCLSNLVGTRFDKVREFNNKYKEDGIIWFFEACDLNVMGIRRALWQLKNAGWFENLKGFMVGRPLCFGENFLGLDQYEAVTGVLGEFGVPVIMDLDIGHLSPMMPLVVGSYADIRVNGNDISVSMKLK